MQEQIGRYEIRREIGRGGMATVYLAYDPRFKRQVAIKVLPRQFTHDPKYLARFEQEAQLIGTLEHPAIVPVYDFGEHNDAPYLVMRYMAGGSLRDRLRSDPFSLEETAALVERLSPALDKAHEAGIIHRDIKPANILFDEDGIPYLADFGIARLAEASQTMTVVGTPAYMSPEQVEGALEPDGRADIYAVGVMLYELLTGHQPYEAETPTKQMMAHVLQPVPNILAADPELPPEMQIIINKTMAKDRDDRYGSTRELADALKGFLSPKVAGSENIADYPTDEKKRIVKPDSVENEGETTAPDRSEAEVSESVEEAGWEIRPEMPAKKGQTVEPAAAALSTAAGVDDPPLETGRKGGLPAWLWWIGGLALLLIAAFTLRAIFNSGGAENPPSSQATSTDQENAAPSSESNIPPPAAGLGDTWTRPADGMTMVFVPAGAFPMGSEEVENAQPVHMVSLDAFWIDQTEVTNDHFAKFVEETGYETTAEIEGISNVLNEEEWQETEGANWQNPRGPQSDLTELVKHPVVQVTWEDAAAFCAWSGGRLPTEAEWEYAARGPEGLAYPWGNGFVKEITNFCDINCPFDWADESVDDGYKLSAPTGTYQPGESWVGAQDLAGNVWEWVNDWYDDAYYSNSPESNPQGPQNGGSKILHGGSWLNNEFSLRSAVRDIVEPGTRGEDIGFRCVLLPEE